MPKGLPEVDPEEIKEILDAQEVQEDWPTQEQRIQIVSALHSAILELGLHRVIDPVRFNKLNVSPGMLANACLRTIEEVMQMPMTPEEELEETINRR